jgi:hypothetical protein
MADLRVLSRVDALAELERLRTTGLNFDPEELAHSRGNRWRIDDYRQPLSPEPPGSPVKDGSWEVARGLAGAYEFADSSLVRAFFDPREPQEERNMLLEIDFWGLRIYAGVRADGIVDETRHEDGRAARVWRWRYRTLEGHFEMGQIDYEIWKWLDSGDVDFRIHAVSRPAKIDHLIVRFGFLVFGRRKQIEFAYKACVRMAELTSSVLSGERNMDPAPTPDTPLVIRPHPSKQTAIERAARPFRGMIRD